MPTRTHPNGWNSLDSTYISFWRAILATYDYWSYAVDSPAHRGWGEDNPLDVGVPNNILESFCSAALEKQVEHTYVDEDLPVEISLEQRFEDEQFKNCRLIPLASYVEDYIKDEEIDPLHTENEHPR